jgi:CRISPR type III-A-associated RAMP protein Csm4
MGPWRLGPSSGARDRAGSALHSDTLFSALTIAMSQLGALDEWIEATVKRPDPAVRFSTGFPFLRDMLFAVPPQSHWPPQASPKVRWTGARFVPLQAIHQLLATGSLDEDAWMVDGASGCLLPAGKNRPPTGPFRSVVRANAAVDRLTGSMVDPHTTACIEFATSAGIWIAVSFADEAAGAAWSGRVRGALALLADTGFGGERSRGWGRAQLPEITEGTLPELLMPPQTESSNGAPPAWWLLSLFSPAEEDRVEWASGSYSLVTRGGRVESRAAWGLEKKLSRMVAEGSVIVSASPPRGAAQDVAPDGFAHPVYRSGLAFAVPVPAKAAS